MSERKTILDTISNYMSTAPVDVYGLARELGINVIEKTMVDATSGSIQKNENLYTIEVNADHSLNRKRFTIAHELGHFILHSDLIGDGIFDDSLYRSYDSRKNKNIHQNHETQANKFAASVLMPTPLIKKLQEEGHESGKDLAEKLCVSEQAMAIRLGNS